MSQQIVVSEIDNFESFLQSAELESLCNTVDQIHIETALSARRTAFDVWKVGKVFLAIKQKIPYGEFETHCEKRFPNISETTRLNYMRVAEKTPKPQLIALFDVLPDHAYKLLGIKKDDWYQSSESVEWETPQWLFDILDSEFHFSLDVCASEENHKCDRYFSKENDGLAQTWSGICWMNPPYGAEIEKWMSKAKESATSGATVVCLVPARTDTEWWWKNVLNGEIRFLRGRLQFANSSTSAPFPSAVVVLSAQHKARVVWWDEKENSS